MLNDWELAEVIDQKKKKMQKTIGEELKSKYSATLIRI